MKPLIRTAAASDLSFLSEHDRHIPLAELDHAIRLGRILLIECGDQPVGWLRWGMFWDNTPFMNMLFLLEGYRMQGLGRMLVACWEQNMASAGHTLLMTSTQANEAAQLFYRRLGYRDIGGFVLNGEPMELLLSHAL